MAALNVASPTFQGPPGEYVFLANFFDFAYNYVLGIKTEGPSASKSLAICRRSTPFFYFCFCSWDEMDLILSAVVLTEQENISLILSGGSFSFLFQCRSRRLFAVNNSRRTGHVINWLANQWVASATSPRLRTARLPMKLWRRKALVNWLKVPR